MDLLIIGRATDGPSYEVHKPETDRDLLSIFGGNYTELFSVSGTSTALNLSYIPWARDFQNVVDGTTNYLFTPIVSGSSILYGSTGAPSGSTIQIRYTPYLGLDDLICATRNYTATTGKSPYVMRAGGTYASISVSGWFLVSKYPGAKYNNLSVTITSSSLTIYGLEPNFPKVTYIGNNPSDIASQIETDLSLGLSPVRVLSYPPSSFSVGSLDFNGGSDGSFSDSESSSIFDLADIPSDVTHVLVLSTVTSSFTSSLYTQLQDENSQPRVWLLPTPLYTGDNTDFITRMSQYVPYRSNFLGLVVGTGDVNLLGYTVERHMAEIAAVSLTNSPTYNFTNLKVNALTFNPQLPKNYLDALTSVGIMSPTRFIGNDISIYQGIMSDGVVNPPLVNIYSEIYSRSYKVVYDYFGMILNQGKQPLIEQQLTSALSGIPFITNIASLVNYSSNILNITISAEYFDEILSINFNINNG